MIPLRCSACGATTSDPLTVRCPEAAPDDDIDHVLVPPEPDAPWPTGDDPNPFVRYRTLLHGYRVALDLGMRDNDYVDLVRATDEAVERVAGTGFRVTPVTAEVALGKALGLRIPIAVKNETINVSGSHKGRHVFGLLLHLLTLEKADVLRERAPLAIASCGNAALAAATVARAVEWPIEVFVPPSASTLILDRLASVDAGIVVCERQESETGDPCYLRFREAIGRGSLPFGCQGPDNGLTIDGATTLGYELASQIDAIDRIAIQVGGGAFATAVMSGMRRAVKAGALAALPRFHAVQTTGAYPLIRAHKMVVAHGSLNEAAWHRSSYMWPWEREPVSAATGILDDETYDWRTVVAAMLETGGYPVVATEDELQSAHDLVRENTTIEADHTGAAGLAGMLALARRDALGPEDRIAVILSG